MGWGMETLQSGLLGCPLNWGPCPPCSLSLSPQCWAAPALSLLWQVMPPGYLCPLPPAPPLPRAHLPHQPLGVPSLVAIRPVHPHRLAQSGPHAVGFLWGLKAGERWHLLPKGTSEAQVSAPSPPTPLRLAANPFGIQPFTSSSQLVCGQC